mmetsp:Transcript_54649/g.119717  ORF Transcript_54649/g.119717 Transcript_54649/m.119717 type:complete len:436 (+) Transcript_54649:54-1361(+)
MWQQRVLVHKISWAPLLTLHILLPCTFGVGSSYLAATIDAEGNIGSDHLGNSPVAASVSSNLGSSHLGNSPASAHVFIDAEGNLQDSTGRDRGEGGIRRERAPPPGTGSLGIVDSTAKGIIRARPRGGHGVTQALVAAEAASQDAAVAVTSMVKAAAGQAKHERGHLQQAVWSLRERFQTQDLLQGRSLPSASVLGLGAVVIFIVLVTLLSAFAPVVEDADIGALGKGVLFYSGSRAGQARLTCATAEPETFLSAFNLPPSGVALRVRGVTHERLFGHIWAGVFARAQRKPLSESGFDFTLSLMYLMPSKGHITESDSAVLDAFLAQKKASQVLILNQRVEWACFQDVAAQLRQRLHEVGFVGQVHVSLEGSSREVVVYQNQAVSIVKGIMQNFDACFRTERVSIDSCFRINMEPASFLSLIGPGLSGTRGFQIK